MARLVRGDVVARDRVLSRFQRFTLDAATPIIEILDHLASGESIDHNVVQTGLSNALKLLGNTHAHFSVERRQNVLKSLNPDLLHLASEDLFEEAPPNLFGPGFAKVAKERSDAMSALRQARSKPNKPFFEKGAPHPTRARDAPHLAIPGSSLTHNVGDITRAIRGTRAIKATTAVKATTRARGKPQKPKTPANKPAPSRPKSGIVGSPRPGNHVQGSQRPGKHPTPLYSGPGDLTPTLNQIPSPVNSSQTGRTMPPTLTDLARGSCQGSSAPTVVAAAQQPTLPPQNLNISFKTMEWNGPVAGRLSRFIENWKLITTDPWVLNTVQGHQIEFLQQPGFHRLPPMHYSHQEKLAISEEVTKMQGKGAVVPVHRDLQEECFLSNLFLVPKKEGGMRPVINLKGLNHFVKLEHFKMEGLHLLSTMVKPGDWFTKVDLKDAYFHVPIHQTHQKFLSFRWEGRVFQFVCLPFGLASAPRTFTKVMKPALACLRQLGVRCIVYLDDLLIMGQSPEEARQVTANTLALFQALGFLINWEKSILEPKQEIVFLGLLVSSRTMTLSLPSPKLIDLRREIQSLLTKEVVSVRQLAHIVGKLNSTALAVLPAPLHYRELQNLKISSLHKMESYNAQTALSAAARDDLSWWLGQLQRWNGRSFIVKRPEVVIQSDASLRGWGAVYQGQCIQGRWSFEESTWHINCLELKAATLAIQTS